MLAPLMLAAAVLQPPQLPVLEFPEAGLDDPASYDGYVTRFFRDARRNTFQVYVDTRSGRVVHLWADAANASAAFTVRDTSGQPAAVEWGGPGAYADANGRVRVMRHRLAVEGDALDLGWFLLGTMRQERDFVYAGRQRAPYGDPPFILPELTGLIENLERLPPVERARHLALLDAADAAGLRARLEPRMTHTQTDSTWVVRVEQVTLDGRNRMTLELSGDARRSTARLTGRVVRVRGREGRGLALDVTVTTDADALAPLDRDGIFNAEFDAFHAGQQRLHDSLVGVLPASEQARDPRITGFRRLDREIRALELLSSREKLMAGLPNFATYFGRDMMMAALMLEPIASVDIQEHVIGSVLRKLAPSGDVSHEEALGGQAIREHAAEYSELIAEWAARRGSDAMAAAERLARARSLLGDLQAVRENYRMVDDDFQLAVLADRYLSRTDIPAERKRRFLGEGMPGGGRRVDALFRNLALVADRAGPYAGNPRATNLVSFLYRDDDGWIPGSWRDSRAGYANGRFAMDVNVVWVPLALEAMERILASIRSLGLAAAPAPSARFLRDPAALRAAVESWRGARRHFEVRLEPDVMQRRIERALATLPPAERDYWSERLRETGAASRPLWFLALALDSAGRAIPAPNTDPATLLFLADVVRPALGAADPAAAGRLLDVFVRPYPAGLLIDGVGPVVVNDVYADTAVQRRFRDDPYHSPRVVWGREVNLLFLGLARRIPTAPDRATLRDELDVTRRAVEASGLRHNELWSYRIEGDTVQPVRYGTSSDIQLWNVTDLAVRFLLDRLPTR